MKREVRKTEDGSTTIYIPDLDENYHSYHGAIQEAKHVFIENGLKGLTDVQSLRVFEMGFGTGLNALLSLKYAKDNNTNIIYLGVEAFPVEMELIRNLNYVDQIDTMLADDFLHMHNCTWGEQHNFLAQFSFQKIHERIETFQGAIESVDCIFYDAFGPRAQAEMWDIEILEKMYKMLAYGGYLVTYCAKGQLKRDLKSLGFEVESLPGPPGKREMTRAWKRKLI